MAISKGINQVSIQALSDIIEVSDPLEQVDLGSAMLLSLKHPVMGDLFCLSLTDGACAVILP